MVADLIPELNFSAEKVVKILWPFKVNRKDVTWSAGIESLPDTNQAILTIGSNYTIFLSKQRIDNIKSTTGWSFENLETKNSGKFKTYVRFSHPFKVIAN